MKKFAPVLAAYLFLTLANLLDLITSMVPGGFEANPFARDPFHQLLVGHLIVLKALFTLMLLLTSGMLYSVLHTFHEKLALLCAAVVPLYETYLLFGVALQNVIVLLHWFQP